MAQREVVIVDGARTAFGRMGGTLKDIGAITGSLNVKALNSKKKEEKDRNKRIK